MLFAYFFILFVRLFTLFLSFSIICCCYCLLEMAGKSANPFERLLDTIESEKCYFYNPQKLSDARYQHLPFSIRILLEAAIRSCDEFEVCCCCCLAVITRVYMLICVQ